MRAPLRRRPPPPSLPPSLLPRACRPSPISLPPPPPGRETFTYSGSALRDSVDGLLSVLSEAITQPKLVSWEVEEQKAVLAAQLAAAAGDTRTALLEALHSAAYGASSPLGHGLFATPEGLDALGAEEVRAFLGARFAANKMVITATSESAARVWRVSDRSAVFSTSTLPPPPPFSPARPRALQTSTTPPSPTSWTSTF